MPRYAMVELSNMTVVNVANVTSVPAAAPGFRTIVETANPATNEWKTGVDEPAVGEIWDGQIPAGFAPPPPITDMPSTMPEAWQLVQQRKALLAEAEVNFETVAGLP